MNTLLWVLFSLVPVLCLMLAAVIDEKEPPTYLDIWYGEDT
jgi:hypothetical protein